MMMHTNTPRRNGRAAAGLIALMLVAGACVGSGDDSDVPGIEVGDRELDEDVDPSTLSDDELLAYVNRLSDEEFDDFTEPLSDDEFDELIGRLDAAESISAEGAAIDPGAEAVDDTSAAPGSVDPSLTRDDVECGPDELDFDDSISFSTAHLVVDGRLGAACFGEADAQLTESWVALATIVPPGQLADLGLFGAFATDGDTLAFVNALDVDGTLFQMSVNVSAYAEDPSEGFLTMAHEFSHVFTSLPSQLDRSDEAFDACATYFNGEGCYAPDSIVYQWISEFWSDGLIDQIDPDAEATPDVGQARCDADAGFFGSYAASNPEEDFAESFSAYVFGIETFSPGQQERVDWIADQPGLAEFRERAVAAGIEPPPNNFDECGLG